MPTDSDDSCFPLSHTSALLPLRLSAVLATRIWYAACRQARSELSLCQEKWGVTTSTPRGFSRYSQRRWTGAAYAAAAVRIPTIKLRIKKSFRIATAPYLLEIILVAQALFQRHRFVRRARLNHLHGTEKSRRPQR